MKPENSPPLMSRLSPPSLVLSLVAFAILSGPTKSRADDWPQWRGPNRDGISSETGLLDAWPEAGPPVAWKCVSIGGGYAPPAIADGAVYGSGFQDGQEFVWALSEADGKELWKTAVAQVNYENIETKYATGPRATPTVDGDLLGTWISAQRSRHRKGTLEPDRIQRLQELPGWTWDVRADKWDEGFSRLQEYVKQHGDARVPSGYSVDG